MNVEKFTERARGFLQAAQTIALREGHQRLTPEHLAKALLDDPEGQASALIARAGGDARRAKAAVDAAVAKIPKVKGGDGQIYLDTNTARRFPLSSRPGSTRRPYSNATSTSACTVSAPTSSLSNTSTYSPAFTATRNSPDPTYRPAPEYFSHP